MDDIHDPAAQLRNLAKRLEVLATSEEIRQGKEESTQDPKDAEWGNNCQFEQFWDCVRQGFGLGHYAPSAQNKLRRRGRRRIEEPRARTAK